jgi:hypothetical protein
MPSQKQPLRGLSPHPPPLSPTRGEGSKTLRPRLQLACENNADRELAQSQSRASKQASARERFSPSPAPSQASARERFSPSPAGGRGGRGVRVVTAQPQAQQTLMPPQSHASVQSIAHPHSLAKAAIARTFPSPPAPLPDPGRGEQNSQSSLAISRGKQGRSQAGAIAIASKQASERMRAFLPLARWRERGPGGEGGDRATPSATSTYATPILCERTVNRSPPFPRQSSHCADIPLTPRPSPRPGARGARQSDPACN